jgi:hypothetical protein
MLLNSPTGGGMTGRDGDASNSNQAGQANDNEKAGEIVSGFADNRVTLSVTGNLMFITVENEAGLSDIHACLAEGLARGLVRTNMLTLVDATKFYGIVEWEAMYDIFRLAPWGSAPPPESRVAYVARDGFFFQLVKIAAGIFPKANHRLFKDRAEALDWLLEAQPSV